MDLTINKSDNGKEIVLVLEGQLNTATAPELAKTVDDVKDIFDSMVLDCEKLDYLSSAGLRVVLTTDEAMRDKGGLTLKNVGNFVYEILDDVGFTDFLKIERVAEK